jgi:hypothetical protein
MSLITIDGLKRYPVVYRIQQPTPFNSFVGSIFLAHLIAAIDLMANNRLL